MQCSKEFLSNFWIFVIFYWNFGMCGLVSNHKWLVAVFVKKKDKNILNGCDSGIRALCTNFIDNNELPKSLLICPKRIMRWNRAWNQLLRPSDFDLIDSKRVHHIQINFLWYNITSIWGLYTKFYAKIYNELFKYLWVR